MSKPVDFAQLHLAGGYASEDGLPASKRSLAGLGKPSFPFRGHVPGQPHKDIQNTKATYAAHQQEAFRKEVGAMNSGMDAYSRHQKLVQDYIRYYGKEEDLLYKPKNVVTHADILKQEHRFVRTAEDDATDSWEKRMAKKYYDKLFKEYCIADLSRYKEGKVGMRWRTEQEVLRGKGQFVCGNKACEAGAGGAGGALLAAGASASSNSSADLKSYEVNFAYVEAGVQKQALVKLRLCGPCAYKLNYRKIKQLQKEQAKQAKKEDKKARNLLKQSKETAAITDESDVKVKQEGKDGEKEKEKSKEREKDKEKDKDGRKRKRDKESSRDGDIESRAMEKDSSKRHKDSSSGSGERRDREERKQSAESSRSSASASAPTAAKDSSSSAGDGDGSKEKAADAFFDKYFDGLFP